MYYRSMIYRIGKKNPLHTKYLAIIIFGDHFTTIKFGDQKYSHPKMAAFKHDTRTKNIGDTLIRTEENEKRKCILHTP